MPVQSPYAIAYDNMALSGLIPNNCPMYIVGVIIIAVPDITHCNVVKAHIDAKGIPLLIKPPLAHCL